MQFLPYAQRELASLPKDIQRRIARRIDALALNPHPADAKTLQGGDRLNRIRVGDYRVIYRVDGQQLVVIVRIGHRSDVYS